MSRFMTCTCSLLVLLHLCIAMYRVHMQEVVRLNNGLPPDDTAVTSKSITNTNTTTIKQDMRRNVLEELREPQGEELGIELEEREHEGGLSLSLFSQDQDPQDDMDTWDKERESRIEGGKFSVSAEADPYAKNDEDTDAAYYYYYYYYEDEATSRDGDKKPIVVKGKKYEKKRKPMSLTGAWSNCTIDHATSTQSGTSKALDTHPDSGVVIISCREISYRAPLAEIEKGGSPVVVGVLSGAGGKGPTHRDSIRSTWANGRKGIYFLVAGSWEDISHEFTQYHDLIWIDEEELYEGEHSVLPFKTESFFAIIHTHSRKGEFGYKYLFKTDDDSYVDMKKLENALLHEPREEALEYWGCCTTRHYAPLRDPSLKWHVTYEMYPEEMYPLYCQGAGFAIARSFIECVVEDHHIRDFRYNPFEDVSIGLLAERCGVKAVSDPRISQFRANEGEQKMLAVNSMDTIEQLPEVTMESKILQHRVKTHYDMYAHYICTLKGC